MRREMFEDGGRGEREERGMEAKKRRYMEFAREIEAAVEAGKLSKEDAEKKLIAVRREMFEDGGRGEREEREMEAKKRRYMEFAREIEAAVEAGKLSEEDAEKRLIEVRKKMFKQDAAEDRDD